MPGTRQRGVALVISLVLLVAMTVVGIATLSGTRTNERIASNAQQKSIAFEVAESAIDAAWGGNRIWSALGAQSGSYANPPPIDFPVIDQALSDDFDQDSVDVSATLTVQYCGEGPPVSGTELNADESGGTFVGLLADVRGVAVVEATGTNADHVQRVQRNAPRTGRVAACTTPGL